MMQKIMTWLSELSTKVETQEKLKYRQVKSLKSALDQLISSLSALKLDDNIEISQIVLPEVVVESNNLEGFLSVNKNRQNKAFIQNPLLCLKIKALIENGTRLIKAESLPDLDRELFLKHLAHLFTTHDYMLVYDLEMTCDENGITFDSETIEIGLCVIDNKTLSIVDRFESLICPVINPTLTPVCVEITGISQECINRAHPFPIVAKQLSKFLYKYPNSIAVQWGGGDMRQLQQDSQYHGVDNPFQEIKPIDLKKVFSTLTYKKNSTGLMRVATSMGIEIDESRKHRALYDAEVTYKVLLQIRDAWYKEYQTTLGRRKN